MDYGTVERPAAGHFSRSLLPYRMVAKWAVLQPEKSALVSGTRNLTYREIMEATDRLAGGLHALGLRAGRALVVIMANRWEHLPLFLAIARLGAVHVSLPPTMSADAVRLELEEIRPAMVVGEHATTVEDVFAAASGELPPLFGDETAPLSLRHSSGTTGRPKKTLASQRASALVYQELATEMRLTDADVHLATGSLAHAALQMALTQLTVGGTVVVSPFNAGTLWQDCERFGATNLMLMPTMLGMASEHAGEVTHPFTIFTAGASLALPIRKRLMARFPALRLYSLYSATEAGHVACLRPEDLSIRPLAAGRAYFSTEIGIFDDHGRPLPAGQLGDIYVRGPMTTYAYLGPNVPLPAPVALRDGQWLRLGDVGYLDEENYLFIADRSADIIVIGGETVLPSEIESMIREVEGVREVAVIGVVDENGQTEVSAYVEGQCDREIIRERCSSLSGVKSPRRILFVESLPRTASGKISRHLLRQQVAKGEIIVQS